MAPLFLTAAAVAAFTAGAALAQDPPKPNFPNPWTVPRQSEDGQSGTNQCGSGASQNSMCQTMFINSLNDFCLWAPPTPNSDIAATEEVEVAWCTAPGRGTRVIPPGTIQGAHWVQTPNYIQITGQLNGPMINIIKGNAGGELDPHGASGNGNPIGSLVYTTAFGNGVQQVKEWMSFMGDGEFCFRICNPADPNAPRQCAHEYDTMGCEWVMPGNYNNGFDSCAGDSIPPPGVQNGYTWHQGMGNTPGAHNPGATSQCTQASTIVPSLVNIPNAPYNSALSASSASVASASAMSVASASAASASRANAVAAAASSSAAMASSSAAAASATSSQAASGAASGYSRGAAVVLLAGAGAVVGAMFVA